MHTCTVSSLTHQCSPAAFMAFSHRVQSTPPFPCVLTHRLIDKCNTHASSPLTHACMRTHFLSLPPLPSSASGKHSGGQEWSCAADLALVASVAALHCVLGLPSLSLSSTSGPAYHGLVFFCLFFFFFFCLVNKCIWSTHSRTTYGLSIVYG